MKFFQVKRKKILLIFFVSLFFLAGLFLGQKALAQCGACYSASNFFQSCFSSNPGTCVWRQGDPACCGSYSYQYQYEYQYQGEYGYQSQYGYQGQYGYQSQYGYEGEYSYQGQYGYEYQYQGEYSYQYQVQPNLDVTGVSFFDANGNQRSSRQFHPLESIYLRIGIANTGDAYPCCTSRHAIYRNRGSTASVGQASDIPMYIDSGTNWPPGFNAIYESWSGGARANQYTRSNFSVTSPGTYTLRVFADYNNRIGEETSSDNQATLSYTILPPDLVVTAFELRDQAGVVRGSASDPFFTTDTIYPRVTFRNQGTGRANSSDGNTDSRIYAHKSTRPGVNESPNPGLAMVNGIFDPGYVNTYSPPPFGPNTWAFTPPTYSWTRPTAGTYRAWAAINFNRQAVESNYGNNYSSLQYSVEVPYSISGRVYLDNDQSGSYTTGDVALGGITMNLTGSPSVKDPVVTNRDGRYTFDRVRAGTYTVNFVLPDNLRVYNNGGSNSRTYTLGPDRTGADFGLIGKYTISGKLFVDDNLNGTQDSGESDYPGRPSLAVTNKPQGSPEPYITPNSNGTYEVSGIIGRESWAVRDAFSGYSGPGYLSADLDVTRYFPRIASHVPLANYRVNFNTTGTYYVWIRGYGRHNGADSVHLGVNGTHVSSSDNIYTSNSEAPYNYTTWGWSNGTVDGPVATINVPSTGQRTLNLAMREDGTFVDKIVLTRSASFEPSGTGPSRSSFSGGTYTESGGQLVIEAETFTSNTDIGGDYSLSLTLPAGYYATNPLPPLFNLRMSGTCPPLFWSTATGATCSNGNISNLNFGINPAQSWFQSRGGDLRFDQGFTDTVPSTPAAACEGPVASRTGPQSTTPGVIFSGDKLPVFGSGTASETNWQVGNAADPEIYNPINPTSLRTSYAYVESSASQQGETFVNLPCNYGNCNLSNLSSGYYKASNSNGTPVNLVLNVFSMDSESDIVILVDGALRINTNIDVPQGSSLTVIVRDNIVVASNIGYPVNPGMQCPPPGNIEGLYSTDNSFILESRANCSAVRDRMLAIEGGIVVQADLSGGIFQNDRTLCDLNVDYPSFVVTERPDIILNMPDLIKVPTYTWQEIAP